MIFFTFFTAPERNTRLFTTPLARQRLVGLQPRSDIQRLDRLDDKLVPLMLSVRHAQSSTDCGVQRGHEIPIGADTHRVPRHSHGTQSHGFDGGFLD